MQNNKNMKLMPKIKEEIDNIAEDLTDIIIPYPSAGESKEVWKEVCEEKRIAREKVEKILKKYAEVIISERKK